jgi:hypothetical protein
MDDSTGDTTAAAATLMTTSKMQDFVGGQHKHNTTINK